MDANRIEKNFLEQQGYREQEKKSIWFNSLQFQPTIVGSGVLVGILFQEPIVFLALSAILWINALFPEYNPFERFYNAVIAPRNGASRIPPAPGPRRFAQGMAAVFMIGAGYSLLQGWMVSAYIFEGFLAAAFSALLFGKFCLGAYLYHLMQGRTSFANSTCPWS